MNSLFISPHNDDEALFGAYTLMRERPLVLLVTDSYIQANRGDGITKEQRREETVAAMRILGCNVIFAGLPDDTITKDQVIDLFKSFRWCGPVYAPAVQGGNPHHDMIGEAALEVFEEVVQYPTYTKTELYTTGSIEIIPSPEEVELKNKALDCYTSQINLGSTRPHFDAVRGKSEWYF